jgi:hypothetical protein
MKMAIGILIAGIAALANAGVIYSNLGPGDSFLTSGWVVGMRTTPFGSTSLETAAAFTPASNSIFTGVEIAIDLLGPPGDLTIALMVAGSSGTPETVLEKFVVPGPMTPSLVSVQSIMHLGFNAGTEYWLDISATSTAAVWLDNNQGATGPVASNQNGQGFVLLTDFAGNPPLQPAFRVFSGDSLRVFSMGEAADVPEPSNFILVVAGLLFIAVLLHQEGLDGRSRRRPEYQPPKW